MVVAVREQHRAKPTGLKTFSHLATARRIPSDYELVTSALLYYPQKGGFEVQTPLADWYARYQRGSPLRCDDWEAFVDPRETTYASYVVLQRKREAFVDGLLQRIEDTHHDEQLPCEGRELLERTLPVLRFPFHAFQMMASYVGHMAPSGRIAVVLAFQAADEVRRIQRIAYRMAQLRRVQPGFGGESKAAWEQERSWQPLRRAVERALVAYDWGEAFVALNVCLKPLVDQLFTLHLPETMVKQNDHILGAICGSLMQDCAWQREWTRALCELAIERRAENRDVLRDWAASWSHPARRAVEALAPLFGGERIYTDLAAHHDAWLVSLGLGELR
jgi:toluene monooxygenase system protein E